MTPSPHSRSRQKPGRARPTTKATAAIVRELNLGPVSSRWLDSIGIRTLGDVERMGSVQICSLLQAEGHPVSLNLAYALEGAILGLHWTKVPAAVKADLRRQLGRERRQR